MGEMLGIAAVGLALAGTAGQASAAAKAAKMNQQAAQVEAGSIDDQAALQERQFRRKAMLAQGEGRAILAASGVESGSGSPLLQQLDFAKQSELEALSIRRTGIVASQAKRFEGELARSSIKGAIMGGVTQGGSILSSFLARKA